MPDINNENFISKIKEILFNKSRFEFNNNLMKKINDKKFTQKDFEELANTSFSKIDTIEINSIKDDTKFTINSINLVQFQYNYNNLGSKSNFIVNIVDIITYNNKFFKNLLL